MAAAVKKIGVIEQTYDRMLTRLSTRPGFSPTNIVPLSRMMAN